MSDAQEVIVANADYHTRLLSTIAGLDYVPAAKEHQINYIKDLETQLTGSRNRVAQLAQKTKKERKEHEALRDSTTRRLAHKLLGKKEQFEAKESKEEREYVEALEREMTERDKQNAIQQLLNEAKVVLVDLREKEVQHQSAQAELHALYSRVFDGPSEAFPEDDRLEYDAVDAQRQHETIQGTLNAESRAAELLARATMVMDMCQKNIQEALGYSQYDMWGGGSMADMMERNALRNAQANASQVEMLVDQARRISPIVQPVGRVNIAQGAIVSDIFFDNFFTDMAFHNKIKQSAAQVLLANQRLRVERDAAKTRADAAGAQLLRAAKVLDSRRKELFDFRRATFESFAAQNPPPPSYDVVASPTAANFPVPQVAQSTERNPTSIHSTPPFPVVNPVPPDAEQAPTPPPKSNTTPPRISSHSSGIIQMPTPESASSSQWGNRNPYALAMSQQTRGLSQN
ncbi:hypothetical protein CPB84DRAFT_1815383 [Gymnopilus junonius]|uniref:Uncharacterized protein n=1 Tax=Gymnopilus junonius TaxID=109634 RepID=A0A9P5NMP8_GYMJU|nr:hypothetical protein CPB84DRAFT_1815383 [Gymnopilus junonius]